MKQDGFGMEKSANVHIWSVLDDDMDQGKMRLISCQLTVKNYPGLEEFTKKKKNINKDFKWIILFTLSPETLPENRYFSYQNK